MCAQKELQEVENVFENGASKYSSHNSMYISQVGVLYLQSVYYISDRCIYLRSVNATRAMFDQGINILRYGHAIYLGGCSDVTTYK